MNLLSTEVHVDWSTIRICFTKMPGRTGFGGRAYPTHALGQEQMTSLGFVSRLFQLYF